MSEAATGLIGVIIGAMLAPLIDMFRAWLHTKKEARYLAIRMVCILDNFVGACSTIAGDAGTPDQDGYYQYSKLPSLPAFPEDVDWKSIDYKLSYAILNLPNKIATSKSYISASAEFMSAPYDDLAPERQYEFASLGLAAAGIAAKLRCQYGLPPQEVNEYNPDWNTLNFLRETKEKIEKRRKEDQQASAAFFESKLPREQAS